MSSLTEMKVANDFTVDLSTAFPLPIAFPPKISWFIPVVCEEGDEEGMDDSISTPISEEMDGNDDDVLEID